MTQVPYALEQPVDAEDARRKGHDLAVRRREARKNYERALVEAAKLKSGYRKALAMAHVSAQGETAAQRKADAESRAADAEFKRDLAEGMVKVAQEHLNEIDGERATFHRLVEWSMRLDPFAGEDRS